MYWKTAILALLAAAWLTTADAAQVYQWTDEKGVKHYTNKKPPDAVDVEAVKKEIATDPAAERAKDAKDAEVVREIEARRQQEASQTSPEALNRQKSIEEKQSELDALGDQINRKRSYLRRRGRQDINAVNRLEKEIEALRADPNADPQKIKALENERDAVKEKIYTKPRRSRKGVGDDIKQYQELEEELKELKND